MGAGRLNENGSTLGEEATRVWFIGSFMTFLCCPQETPGRSENRPRRTNPTERDQSLVNMSVLVFYHEPNVQHEDNLLRDEIDDFHDAKERVRGLFVFLRILRLNNSYFSCYSKAIVAVLRMMVEFMSI